MTENLLEQLARLSETIDQEEISLSVDRIARASMPEIFPEEEDPDPREETEKVKSAVLLLRCLRVPLCLEALDLGYREYAETFRKDWKEILECLKFLEDTSEESAQLLSTAADLICLLQPECRQSLLRRLGLRARLKIKQEKPLRIPVIDIALRMADYCLETGRLDALRSICANLIALALERTLEIPECYRSLFVMVLRRLVDTDPALTVQLCQELEPWFDDTADEHTCLFCWIYGFDALTLNLVDLALPLLEYCYELCMDVEGETSWIGMRANSIVQRTLLKSDQSREAEAYLWDTLEKMDAGFYTDMDDNMEAEFALTLAMLLGIHMENQDLRGYLPQIWWLMDYCTENEAYSNTFYLTVRRTENLLAGYFRETGDYLQAVAHTHKALESIPPNGQQKIPSDIILYSNLLQIYTDLRDIDQIRFYIDKLIDLEQEYGDDPYLSDRIDTLLNNADTLFEMDEEDLESSREYLEAVCEAIKYDALEPPETGTDTFVWSIITSFSELIDSGRATREDLLRLRYVMEYFWNHPEIYTFNDIQNLTYHIHLADIEARLGSDKTLGHLDYVLTHLDHLSEVRSSRSTILRAVATIYYLFGQYDRALATLEKALEGITSTWQKAVSYLNDQRICQLLASVQTDFLLCYTILRGMYSARDRYEQILRFKDLPALIGRERNTFLRHIPVDEDLRSEIARLQDQLAADELNDSLKGTDTARETAAQLERLEARFDAKFPRDLQFTDITFDRVCQKLPEDSAIVEYYFTQNREAISLTPDLQEAVELDIFITTKVNGQTRLECIQIPDGNRIRQEAAEFVHILCDPEDLSAGRKKEALRNSLHRSLLAPVLPLLEGISRIYLAPDDLLCSVPFEILSSGGSGTLPDIYQVCRLVSGRDLLFFNDSDSWGGGSFILGDPNYESQRGQQCLSRTRGAQGSLEPMNPLPFSGIEARRISRRLRCQPCSGDAATKYALQEALPARVIHLATHGVYDEALQTDSLYASHLVFAGYNKWVRNLTESSFCGNGILTADEISRMDLRKTELVVLSACQSSLGDTSYGSVRGLLSAFSAAGARWVVSHMWNANDFATPILMDAFYDAFRNRGMDVPDALQQAKSYLKTITIGDLRRDGWLDAPADPRIPEEIREELAEMRQWPDEEQPFEDEYFWGGFTVHKCR